MFVCCDAVGDITNQAEPDQTFMLFDVALKYIAPTTKALPSLSVDGSDAFAPKYRSSNESKDAAALVAELADDVADVAELPADVAAAAALVAAAAVEPNKVSV